MPSGYTSDIYYGKKEVTGKDFILQCSRAFGALVMMRDDPADAPIPDEIKPSTYSYEKLMKEQEKLADLYAMKEDKIKELCLQEYEKNVIYFEQSIRERKELKARYEKVLEQIEAWAPFDEHVKLKEFCIEQLKDSIRHDCDLEYYELNKPRLVEPQEWLQDNIEHTLKNISYYAKQHQQEIERARERTEWVQKLKASLENM